MTNLDQKTIFITGASAGLGRATAKLFASKGWKVVASMRDPKKEKELGSISGIRLMSLDVTDPDQIESVAEQVVGLGGVDVVFNNAGSGLAGALEGLSRANSTLGKHEHVRNDPHNKSLHPALQRETGRTVHQHDFAWWVGVISVQLHLSRNQMGNRGLE